MFTSMESLVRMLDEEQRQLIFNSYKEFVSFNFIGCNAGMSLFIALSDDYTSPEDNDYDIVCYREEIVRALESLL